MRRADKTGSDAHPSFPVGCIQESFHYQQRDAEHFTSSGVVLRSKRCSSCADSKSMLTHLKRWRGCSNTGGGRRIGFGTMVTDDPVFGGHGTAGAALSPNQPQTALSQVLTSLC